MRNSITFFVILFLLLFGPGNKDGFPISEDTIKFEIAKKHFQKGIRYYNRMQYLAAIEFFRKAVSEYHEYYTAMEYLARSYKLAGFVDEALKRWENLAKLTSNPVAINDKIDTIRYRETRSPSVPILSDFVFSGKYLSSDSGRFHFSAPVDIAIDREKNLYITSFSSGKLIKLNSNGEGITVTSPALTGKLYGVDYSKNRIVVSDFKNDIVYIMDVNCKILKSFGSSGIDHGRFHGPEGVCFDNDGNIYVVDSGNNRIQKFDSDGGFILQFGESGEYEGQLQNPSDIVVFNNVVYVTDSGNNRLSCFDTSGNYIKDIAIKGMMNPRGINVYNDSLIISDEKAGLLSYKPDNAKTDWLKLWDNNKEKFSKLISAVGDREQILYCLDFNKEAVFIFSPVVSRYTNLDLELTKVDIKHYPVVAFYMNVRNRSGKPIYGLKRDDFRIREDGADIHGLYIDYLKNRDPSTSIVICIDRSYKNRKYHYDIPWVSEFILKKMRKNDSVKVI
ncbi:MAG: hypothetical protein SVR08_05125, partial [Spirochaetota bacterium]|nr:hypothetical protein [Spirochaetota bacterium]